jgi:hypothetical protein
MALNRRSFLLGVPLVAGGLGCASGTAVTQARTAGRLASAPSPGKPTVLVCMPDTKQTREVWSGLKDELAGHFSLIAVDVDGDHGGDVLSRATVFAYAR